MIHVSLDGSCCIEAHVQYGICCSSPILPAHWREHAVLRVSEHPFSEPWLEKAHGISRQNELLHIGSNLQWHFISVASFSVERWHCAILCRVKDEILVKGFKGPVNNSEDRKLLSREIYSLLFCDYAAARVLQIRAILRKLQGLKHQFQPVLNFCVASPLFSLMKREGIAYPCDWFRRPINELCAMSSCRSVNLVTVVRCRKGAWQLEAVRSAVIFRKRDRRSLLYKLPSFFGGV